MMNSKMADHHLARQACIYIRQSTPGQVRFNQESKERQYNLANQAKALGWMPSDAGSPSFRCIPFARDVLFDPGRVAAPRIAAPHILHSTLYTVSAPATCPFRGSITHPTQLLCTLI